MVYAKDVSENQKKKFGSGDFKVVIDSTLEAGVMNFAELFIPGLNKEEILLSTYVCHPSMASDGLSGPIIALALGKWLKSKKHRNFTYRILFIPETIGSIYYISRNLTEMKKNIKAGWVLTCLGDEKRYSYVPSRKGGTLADRVSLKTLKDLEVEFDRYSFLERGSDERQYCSPGVDLPVASLMRSKYATYEKYHTSLDDLKYITSKGLAESYEMMKTSIDILEKNKFWKVKILGEPQLGKRGLYPTVSTKGSQALVEDLMNVIAYCDGETDMIEISDICNLRFKRVSEIIESLLEHDLIEEIKI